MWWHGVDPLHITSSLFNSSVFLHVSGAAGRDDVADTNFLEWLRDTVYEAVKIAERHESLKLRIREARANIEHRYQLASLQVRHRVGTLLVAWCCFEVALGAGRRWLRNGRELPTISQQMLPGMGQHWQWLWVSAAAGWACCLRLPALLLRRSQQS
jgi:hypothetical protein